jgi:replicative DNA helicase
MNAITLPVGFVVEIEQEVLGTLLAGGDFRRVAGLLEDHHFIEPLHGKLFAVIRSAHERYNSTTVPVVAKLISEEMSLAYKLKVNEPINVYLANLCANTVFGNPALEQNARKLVEQWARLNIAQEAGRLQAAANDPASSPSELVTHAGQTFDDILSQCRKGPKRKTRVSLLEATDNALFAAEEAKSRGSGLTGVTWGLTDVNRLTGGIQKRDLTLIAARPSMGKTTVGLSVAIRAAKAGAAMGFISLEMDSDKLGARAISDMAYDWNVKVPYTDLIRGSVDNVEGIRSAVRDLDKLPLWIEDQSGLSMTDIRIKAEAMMAAVEKSGRSLEGLMIDHIGLIRPSSRYQGNRTNEIAEITSGLKAMAREYGIAVIALSQLNRALETRDDKRPQLSDLRDSGAIEQDADTIIFLFREAYYLEREKAKSADAEAQRVGRLADCYHKLEFAIAKQRNGPVRTVDLFCDMAFSAVRNGVRQ